MGIKSIYTDTTGQVQVNPRRVKIITYDGLSTVTTAGYLSVAPLSTYSVYPTDVFDIIYSYSDATNSGTYGEFLPTFSNGIVTLSQAASSGITLPTIANHIAVFSNTTGQLGEDAATAINGGNIQAGLSGTAGYVASFPATGSKGSLRLTAVANTGDTLVTISNALHGQASVYSIPDSGASTANLLISKLTGTQHITVGSLAVDAGTLTSGIATGGTVGKVILFPTTASKGSLTWQAVANSGDTATIFQTAALGQAVTYTFPDPAGATGAPLVAPSALVSGNLVKASGTAGLIVDAAFALHAGTTASFAGGGTTNTFTTTNMTSSSIVTANIVTSTNSVSITKAVPGTNQLAITFSADPGASTTLNWISITPAVA